jgi:zinc protease
MSMAALILADGDSSRFYQEFVHKRNWIAGLFASPNHYRGPQLFRIFLQVQQGISVREVVSAVDRELGKIADKGVTAQELSKARNQVKHRFLSRVAKVSQVGELLAHYSTFYGDTNLINEHLARFMEVTEEDIRKVVATYLRQTNRSSIFVEPQP